MSEHTKEPWRTGKWPDDYIGLSEVCVDTPNGAYVLAQCNTNFLDTAKANARRIVACVNACAGIPTHGLEGIRFAVTLAEFADCQQQRDELLAALERLLAAVEPDPAAQWAAGTEVEQARSAIAKVKPC